MNTLQHPPSDGPFDIKELVRTLLETMVNEIVGAQADMAGGDRVTRATDTVSADWPPPSATSRSASPSYARRRTFR